MAPKSHLAHESGISPYARSHAGAKVQRRTDNERKLMTLTPRRLVAVLTAVATVAGSAALLTALPASAATSRLMVDTTTARAAAGTCTVVTVTPTDTFGVPAPTADTVTVLLSETPSSATQDLDFCTTDADTPSEDPSYTNGADFDAMNVGASDQSYRAGPGITGNGVNNGGTPDAANNASQPSPNSKGDGGVFTMSNPSGVDRARYLYTPAKGGIRVGVVGLTPGTGTLKAFFDQGANSNRNNFKVDSDEVQAPTVGLTFTDGGQPGSTQAAAAVSRIALKPADGTAAPGSQQNFTATLTNSSGDTVRGIRPLIQVSRDGANPGATAGCDDSDNAGVSRCVFIGTNPGTDTLTIFVNKAGGSAGFDGNETFATSTRTTTKAPVAATNARYLTLSPKTLTTQTPNSATFTATVTDVNGAPAQGVQVTFTESGPGSFAGGPGVTRTTDSIGQTAVLVTTTAGEMGDETIAATIITPNTQCSMPAGAGSGATSSTPPGQCSDTATHTIRSSSTSPTPTATGTTSATPTPTPTMTTTTTTTATATSTAPACQIARVTVNTQTINATGLASVTVFDATPGARVELQGYSQNHFGTANFDNDPTPVDRAGTTDSSGTITFNDLRPSSNTRVRARQVGCPYGGSEVINVRTTIFLKVTRNGPRTYTFDIDSIPARPGGLIVSIYRITGQTCPAGVEPRNCPGEPFVGQSRVSSIDGTGSRTLRFDSSFGSRERFVLKTGQDAQNAPGRSNVRDLAIF